MSDERVDILLALKTELNGATEALSFIGDLKEKIVGLAIASAPALLVRENGELAMQIKAVAAQTGITTDALQILKYGMEENAVQVDTLARGLVTLKRNLEIAAADGKSPMNKALETLHLDAAGLQALAPEQQLAVIGDRLNTAVDKNAAFNAGIELLGAKNAPKLLESLRQLANEGLAAWDEKSKSLRLSEEQLNSLDRAGIYLHRIAEALKLGGAHTELGIIAAIKASVAANGIDSSLLGGGGDIYGTGLAAYDNKGPAPAFAGSTAENVAAVNAAKEAQAKKAAADALQSKMDAAAAKAETDRVIASGQKIGMKVTADEQEAISVAIRKTQEAMVAQNKELDKEAQHYKELADPAEKYRREIMTVEALERRGKMTKEQAALAIDQLKASMGQDFQHAVEASQEALRGFEGRLNAIADNPFLTDVQKRAQRVEVLKAENSEIERQLALLNKFAAEHPGADAAGIRSQSRSLSERGVRNDKEINRPDLAGAGTAANLRADLAQLQNQVKTPAQNIAATISGTIGGAFNSVHDNLTGLVMGTQSWHQSLLSVARTIETDLVSGIVRMFTQWIEQRALSALAGMAWSKAEGASDVAAKAPGAALSSISSFGTAAIIGVAALVAAMAAFGGFEAGGYTGNIDTSSIAGVVHGREYVFDAANTARLGPDFLDNLRFSPSPMAAIAGGAAGGSGVGSSLGGAGGRLKPARVIHVVAEGPSHAEQLMRDPNFDNEMLSWTRRHLGVG